MKEKWYWEVLKLYLPSNIRWIWQTTAFSVPLAMVRWWVSHDLFPIFFIFLHKYLFTENNNKISHLIFFSLNFYFGWFSLLHFLLENITFEFLNALLFNFTLNYTINYNIYCKTESKLIGCEWSITCLCFVYVSGWCRRLHTISWDSFFFFILIFSDLDELRWGWGSG